MKLTLENAPNGQVTGISRDRLSEYPFFLLTQPPDNSVSVSANQSADAKILSVSSDAPMCALALGHQKTGAMLVQLGINDGATPRWLCNAPVNVATIFGNNGKPYYLPTPLILPEMNILAARFTDVSGSSNAIRFSVWGGRYARPIMDLDGQKKAQREQSRSYMGLPFFYTIIPSPASGQTTGALQLLGNATSQQSIEIIGDSHFQLTQISAVSTGEFSLNIKDAASGESMIDGPAGTNYGISSNLICGDGNFPWKLPFPITYKRGSKMILDIADLSGSTNQIFLTLAGRMIPASMPPVPRR